MAESTDSTPDELIQAGESKEQAVSRLLQETFAAQAEGEGDDAPKPTQLDAAPADGEPAPDELSEIDTDDLGIQQPDDSGDTDKSFSALHELAEKSGITIEDIYKLEVGMPGDSSPVTLGQLKDSYKDVSEIEQARGDFEEHRTAFENELIRARGELTEVLNLMPEIPPEVLAQGRQRYAATLDKERKALLEIKPEWADPIKFQHARDFMVEAVAEYGFHASELDAISDHRLTKMVHDFAVLRKRVQDAKDSRKKLVRDHKPLRSGSRTPVPANKQNASVEEAAQSTDMAVKVGAVAGLLNAIGGDSQT